MLLWKKFVKSSISRYSSEHERSEKLLYKS